MKVSFLIPAFNAADTLGATLASVHDAPRPAEWRVECVVVDDGSADGDALAALAARTCNTTLIAMPANRGKSAALNAGLPRCGGDIVVQLDADDTLVPDWPAVLARILEDWPEDHVVCFSACLDQHGRSTVARPDYTGPITFEDMLAEQYMGEYLPMFRRALLPAAPIYHELHRRCPCEWLAYVTLARSARLWVSAEIMRVYHTDRGGSISAAIMRPETAAGLVVCYDAVLETFGDDFRRLAPRRYQQRCLRRAVFAALARDPRRFRLWRRAASWRAPVQTVAAFAMMIMGRRATESAVRLAKAVGLLRRFG